MDCDLEPLKLKEESDGLCESWKDAAKRAQKDFYFDSSEFEFLIPVRSLERGVVQPIANASKAELLDQYDLQPDEVVVIVAEEETERLLATGNAKIYWPLIYTIIAASSMLCYCCWWNLLCAWNVDSERKADAVENNNNNYHYDDDFPEDENAFDPNLAHLEDGGAVGRQVRARVGDAVVDEALRAHPNRRRRKKTKEKRKKKRARELTADGPAPHCGNCAAAIGLDNAVCAQCGKIQMDRFVRVQATDLDDEEECTICLENFGEAEEDHAGEEVCLLPCAHPFHVECVEGWFSQDSNRKCPNCKFEIK